MPQATNLLISMRTPALRGACLVALAVCSVLLTDYLRPSAAYCGIRHGCDQVVFSSYGRPMGAPLPVVGLAAFGLFLGLTFAPRAARLLGPLALLAGFAGVALFLIQWLALRRFCPLCLLVDMSAMLLAIVELATSPRDEEPGDQDADVSAVAVAPRRPRPRPWLLAAFLAVVAPPAWGLSRPAPPAPEAVRALWREGTITVVEVTDFTCPHCRRNHPVLNTYLDRRADEVRFARFVHPAPGSEHARSAARAYLAAERQGRAEAMADALFTAEDLSAEGCARLAARLGLNMAAYESAVSDPATDSRIDDTIAWVAQADPPGLPVLWVQEQRLVGVQDLDGLLAAHRRAARGR